MWETLNPKYSPYSAISFFITVDFPDPLGPHNTRGFGGSAGGMALMELKTTFIIKDFSLDKTNLN